MGARPPPAAELIRAYLPRTNGALSWAPRPRTCRRPTTGILPVRATRCALSFRDRARLRDGGVGARHKQSPRLLTDPGLGGGGG
eukprot:364620-Chlamydomonas_euryale.AAC.13